MLTEQDIKTLQNTFAPMFEQINIRLDKIEQRLDKVEQRLDKVEQRLDKIEQRLDKVELRLDGVETRLDKVEGKSKYYEGKFDRIERKIDELKTEMDRKFSEQNSYIFHSINGMFEESKNIFLTKGDLNNYLDKAGLPSFISDKITNDKKEFEYWKKRLKHKLKYKD